MPTTSGLLSCPAEPPAIRRHQRAREALADLLLSLAEDIHSARNGAPAPAATLHAIGLVAKSGRALLAALDGVELPIRDGDVESGQGQGIYNSPMGPAQQHAENHGQRVLMELSGIARAYLAQQARPKLAELMDAYYQARDKKDAATAQSIREKALADYGVSVDPLGALLQGGSATGYEDVPPPSPT